MSNLPKLASKLLGNITLSTLFKSARLHYTFDLVSISKDITHSITPLLT